MKPCDPRHLLHNNRFEKNDAILSEENKIRGIFGSHSSMGCLSAREPGEQAESSVSSKLFCIPTPPNVSEQLSKNLVNILSNSHQIITTPLVSHSNNVPIINKANQVDAKPTSAELLDSNTTSVVVSEASVGGVSQSANSWRDLDHLLAGFNDVQKAAIQRERARRIAEQNIMFAARKLCLVLDLDHTLLNSAKVILANVQS